MQRRIEEPEWLLPFEFMKAGDSFFLPTLKPEELLDVIDSRAKCAKIKVKAFVTSKGGLLGVRVWRTG